MEEVILISSDEENFEPTPKKAKPNTSSDVDDCIVISFDEEGKSASESPKKIETEIVAVTNVNNPSEISNEDESSHKAESVDLAISCTNITNGESSSSNFQKCLSEFLELCITQETNDVYKNVMLQKISALKEAATDIECRNSESDLTDLIKIIKLNKKQAKENPLMTLVYFDKISSELKTAYHRKDSEGNPKKEKIIKKLEEAIYKLRKKIRKLEEAEVDFDEDEDSSYIKMQRHRERAAQLYKKYCSYINENPNRGRPCYSRLDISCSKFPEINRAIDKHFKNKDEFPTYYNMEKLIKKCIEKHKLELSKTELNDEVKTCFKKLGELLQTRRKRDLESVHCSFLENLMDPAKEDPELNNKLKENEDLGEKRINEVCEKYVQLQEKNTELNKTDESNSEPSDAEEVDD